MTRVPVAVTDPAAAARHEALLAALEEALPVRFEACGTDAARDRPVVVRLGAPEPGAPRAGAGQRSFAVEEGDGAPSGDPHVRLADVRELDARLRGADMSDPAAASVGALGAAEGETVLASGASGPLWTRAGGHDRVALAPAPLDPGGALLGLLRPDAWLSLLPLLHFLREACAPALWDPPPLRAALLVDDPNLHMPRYGHISYRELVAHADDHAYHTAFAMVPLDGWFAHPRAAGLFRERAERISLLVHGNDHLKRELAQERTESETTAMLAQAQRRIAAFERRSGVEVDRVMAPPHGACSRDTMAALPRLGFDAACVSRPYPWLDGPPAGRTLAGWEAATWVTGGTPVIPRIPIARADGELPLRAFLDQPLVVYGHHDDLSDGLEPFASLAGRINRFGPVRWESLGDIRRSNYASRVDGDELTVRAYSRRLDVEVPPGVKTLRIEVPAPEERPEWGEIAVAGKHRQLQEHGAVWTAEPVPVTDGGRIEVSIPHPAPLDPQRAPRRRPGAWPLVRRTLVEVRDQLEPARRRG